jgi:transcriptional regulator of acetoin/glycerol metabolism
LYGIDPGLRRAPVLAPGELERRLEEDETFAVAAPVFADFGARLRDKGHVLAFLDADGWMLSIRGDERTVARAADVNFSPGASWREDATGTTGPGTALFERRPIEVFASEHFVEAWQAWTCAGAPIIVPGSDEPLGVVGIAEPWNARDPQGLVAARTIACVIEERVRSVQKVREQVIQYAFRAARDSGDALLAVDARGRLLAANDAAGRRLAIKDGQLPRAVGDALCGLLKGRRSQVDEEIPVDLEWPGVECRRAVCSTLSCDEQTIGAIVRIVAPTVPRAARGDARARPVTAARYGFEHILGRSEPMRGALELARVAARNDLPVVLHGESGTGKELFAQSIHGASDRARGAFVALNCGAIPAPLVEAELFGYESGTFTGAQRGGRAGRFEEAHGGTLLFDEVSELSPQAQTALLRVLQELEVVRLGGGAARRIDMRVIAATNRNLGDEVASGRFRQDLFFRLNVLTIAIPPLRARGEDVSLLARAFLVDAEERIGRPGLELSREATSALAAYAWPGNVRELRNAILRAAATATGPRIEVGDLLLVEVRGPSSGASPAAERWGGERRAAPSPEAGVDREREDFVAALETCGWNVIKAASSLGVSRMTIYRRLRKYGITR